VPFASESVVEVVTPRTNQAGPAAAENFLAAVGVAPPFALEIAADGRARRFLVRAGGAAAAARLAAQLGGAYPQAVLRPVDGDADPAVLRPHERGRLCRLRLRAAAYLPIRTFGDEGAGPAGAAGDEADPVLGILAALGDLPPGWRALAQLVLRPAPADWCREAVRLSVQHPLADEHAAAESERPGLLLLLGLLLAGVCALQGYRWYLAGRWQWLALLGAAAMLGTAGLVVLARHLARRRVHDPTLVREKVRRPAFRAELRLAVFASAEVPERWLDERLQGLVAAYHQYDLAAGNGFVAGRPLDVERDLSILRAGRGARRWSILTTRELAGLWHLPRSTADAPLVERTHARRWLPLPPDVANDCRIGASRHQGRDVPVSLPDALLRRHLLLVAKTRRGKSSLLLRLAGHAMTRPGCLLVVDPHRDLARSTLSLVPPARRADVVYLDVGDTARPFGLNLLDSGLGWDRDRAVANALTIFRREWDGFWGPRMEDAFRFALASLVEANVALCADDPDRGRQRQYTLLDVPAILSDARFRRDVLARVRDPAVHAWWRTYFEPLDRRFQLEIINPVLSKVHRFQGSRAASAIVGQPRSTIDPDDWLRRQAIVVVDTARGTIGESSAALIGATLVNLVGLVVARQVEREPAERRPISVIVDEFHTLPGADYELILSELSKYGANLILATQSLARLAALDGDERRALRATVFANLDGLFAFNCSAEDAEYLAPELGGSLDAGDLVELGEHQCYARVSLDGERLPAFWVALDPPPVGDAAVAAELAEASARRYGARPGAVPAAPTPAAEVAAPPPMAAPPGRPRRRRARAARPPPPRLGHDDAGRRRHLDPRPAHGRVDQARDAHRAAAVRLFGRVGEAAAVAAPDHDREARRVRVALADVEEGRLAVARRRVVRPHDRPAHRDALADVAVGLVPRHGARALALGVLERRAAAAQQPESEEQCA
jgi:hypothetical protein